MINQISSHVASSQRETVAFWCKKWVETDIDYFWKMSIQKLRVRLWFILFYSILFYFILFHNDLLILITDFYHFYHFFYFCFLFSHYWIHWFFRFIFTLFAPFDFFFSIFLEENSEWSQDTKACYQLMKKMENEGEKKKEQEVMNAANKMHVSLIFSVVTCYHLLLFYYFNFYCLSFDFSTFHFLTSYTFNILFFQRTRP